MRALLFLALALSACKWTDFDDLEGETWVRSTEDPELGSSDYAVAIAGVSQGTSGGTLAVLSDDSANYSTLTYSAKGEASVGANPMKLVMQQIGAINDAPVFITDPTGRIALVERSMTGGNFAVVFGTATAPAALEFAAATNPAAAPDAAVFVPNSGGGNDIVFAAGSTLYKVAAAGGAPVSCMGVDDMAMPLQVAALDHDATDLLVWTKSGALLKFGLDDLAACNGALTGPDSISFTPTGGFMPGPGARIHALGDHAILTAHVAGSRSGSVFVVKLADMTQVGTTLPADGIKTSTIAVFGSDTYLVLGVPDRQVSGIQSGEVDMHAFNPTTGVLDGTPALSLHDADPESGQAFGRGVTTMTFNGNSILVVGASGEIFAYYRTALYDQLP